MNLSFKLLPCDDEAFSSFLIRISRKHYMNSKEFCSLYGITEFHKEPMDIDIDLSQAKKLFGYNINGINTVKSIVNSFNWENGRSKWLITPNKKGASLQNSYTQICPGCLSEKAYIKLKWKFTLFFGCSSCGVKLINRCPNCNLYISPLKGDLQIRYSVDYNPLWNCLNCRFDLRKAPHEILKETEIIELKKLEKAYKETPVNIRYLKFKQFGIIDGLA